MTGARLNRRHLLFVAGAAASTGLAPAMAQPGARAAAGGEITDMTMNAPSYATPIGYGRAGHADLADDPLARAFED